MEKLKKLFNAIINIIKKIIEWIKNLFKKEKIVNYNGKEIKVEKPKFPLISAAIDIASSVIDSKSKTSNYKIKEIEKEIDQLINSLSSKTESEVKETVTKIEEKINTVKKEIRGSLKEEKIVNKELKKLENHENTLDSLKTIYKNENEENKKTTKEENQEEIEDTKKEEPKKGLFNLEKVENQIKENEIIEIKNGVVSKQIDNTPKKLLAYKEYVKYVNELLKDGSKLLKEISEEISPDIDNEIYKYKVEDLKKKIIEIRKQYYDFSKSEYIYILEKDFEMTELDEYEIIKKPDKIDFYLNKCNSVLQTIEYMKEHKEEITEVKSKQKKEEKKEEKKEKKEEIPKILQEIEQANQLVIRDIKAQQKEISKFYSKLKNLNPPEIKVKKFGFFSNFLNNTLRLGIFGIFRTRHLSRLTHGFILNNRVRLMRKIINPNVDIDCITFNHRIKNEIDIINNYQTICNDSLYQISSLKEEYARFFGYNIDNPEIKEVFTKLVDLEDQITREQQNLVNAKIKINNKIKIKRFHN